ncbi:YciI family protein [Marinifilum caeruleilacunae]|uniref:YCII-related domain-containing protein n=1 Tax=Marinifilum caeruleilacunae TaxID=2499076 RepID=A0ABX1X1D5_9BACT|nr:YciI family protein [Marinifilum caeruleilacunae]NOU61895.1 hypothetical protein [Marinifilum caeruleilacunae]
MKLIKNLLFIIVFVFISCQPKGKDEVDTQPVYNAGLAEKLKADQYGMSQYVMAFLKSGPNRSQDSISAVKLQKAHLENIGRLAKEGKLVLAGPFLDDGEIRGIYIFDVESMEEARALTKSDPAVKAGRLVMELHPWYGSAALKQVNELHKSIQKQNVTKQ